MSARNVIIGAAIGYREPQLSAFVASLRRVGYDGDLALIVDRGLARTLQSNADYRRCDLIVAPPWIPHRLGLVRGNPRGWRLWRLGYAAVKTLLAATRVLPVGHQARREMQMALAQHSFQPTETRYMHAYRYVRSGAHERILLSDVRDVLFQSDPFEQLPATGLAVSMETRRLTMGSEAFNAKQVTMAYGDATLRQMRDRPISCCGVTYGDRASMLRYLELMIDEILGLGFTAALYPMDQALHNFILWTGRFGPFAQMETLASPVATLAMLQENELRVSADGRLLNRDGTVPSVVHQHDRWADIAAQLERSLEITHGR